MSVLPSRAARASPASPAALNRPPRWPSPICSVEKSARCEALFFAFTRPPVCVPCAFLMPLTFLYTMICVA